MEKLGADIRSSLERVEARKALIGAQITYTEPLPVAAKAESIKRLLAGHQVLVVAGETGSGKTTQIPKICLEMGIGGRGLIGHTQQRRVAAANVRLHGPGKQIVSRRPLSADQKNTAVSVWAQPGRGKNGRKSVLMDWVSQTMRLPPILPATSGSHQGNRLNASAVPKNDKSG